jgi:hypothetical protein
MVKVIQTIKVSTVGDLLDALTELARGPLWAVMDGAIETDTGTINSFTIRERALSDKNTVYDLWLHV